MLKNISRTVDICLPWQSYKVPMHAYDHGVVMHIITGDRPWFVEKQHCQEVDSSCLQHVQTVQLTYSKHETLLHWHVSSLSAPGPVST